MGKFFDLLSEITSAFIDDDFSVISSDDWCSSTELGDETSFGSDTSYINPANGNPMIDGPGGVDTERNLFGMDSDHFDAFDACAFSTLDTDCFSTGLASTDDFGCDVF